MTKLSRGSLKIVAPNIEAAQSNRMRAGSGGRRFKSVWNIYVLNEDGRSFKKHTAQTFRASSLHPRHEPRGLRQAYPFANSAMRTALEAGLWFETRSEITLDPEQTNEETPDNGE